MILMETLITTTGLRENLMTIIQVGVGMRIMHISTEIMENGTIIQMILGLLVVRLMQMFKDIS